MPDDKPATLDDIKAAPRELREQTKKAQEGDGTDLVGLPPRD